LENIQSKQDKDPAGDSDSNQEAEIQGLREELEEMTEAKDHFETQYKNLLGRVNTIKTSLGDRLKADTVRSPLGRGHLVPGWLY
jgi:archaellum component FlaC